MEKMHLKARTSALCMVYYEKKMVEKEATVTASRGQIFEAPSDRPQNFTLVA